MLAGSALILGIGLRLWQSALSFASLSFIYKSILFLLFGSTDNSSSSLLLHHLLVSTLRRYALNQWTSRRCSGQACKAPSNIASARPHHQLQMLHERVIFIALSRSHELNLYSATIHLIPELKQLLALLRICLENHIASEALKF